MTASRHCPSWADLQPELLGLVLGRLPSLADRVRLAAVCRPWRHSARLEPVPPPFPWLTVRDGTFLSIPDGKIYRLPLVPPDNFRCIGSVDNWLCLEQTGDGGSLLALMNPFSKDVMHLPDADTISCHGPVDGYRSPCFLIKLVLLSSMDLSPDSVFAVLMAYCMYESLISICQASTASAFHVPDRELILDVEFVDGKLYALSPRKLFVLEVESSSKCKPKISSMKCIANDVVHQTVSSEECMFIYFSYLVESSGRLLHVTRLVGGLSVSPGEDRTKFCRTFSFDVFEVDLTTSSSAQRRRLNSLEGEALFVGPYSKALHASKYGAQADCIYFMCDYGGGVDCPEDPFRDSGVFNMTNGTITPSLPETMIMQVPEGIAKGRSADQFYSARPSWFFPKLMFEDSGGSVTLEPGL